MAIVNLLPNADGTVQQWIPSLSVPHWTLVDDAVGFPDEDFSFVYTSGFPLEESFNHVDFGIPGAIISNVRVVARMRYDATGLGPIGGVNVGIRIGVARYAPPFNANLSATYWDYNTDWPYNPNAPMPNTPWTTADVDSLQSSLLSVFARNAQIRCTQIYLIVTYEPPAPPPPEEEKGAQQPRKTWGEPI